MTTRERWLQWLAGMVLAALVAYFTTTGAIQSQLSSQKATEESHFAEVLRQLTDLKTDIRELRDHQR